MFPTPNVVLLLLPSDNQFLFETYTHLEIEEDSNNSMPSKAQEAPQQPIAILRQKLVGQEDSMNVHC